MIKLHYEPKLTYESSYLRNSNKKKCTEILNKKDDLTEDEIIDFFISLHMVLEVSLHSLFRQLSHPQVWQLSLAGKDELEIIKKNDEIGFIAKTNCFIENSKFNFDNKLIEEKKHHKIIGKLKQFSEMRNKLIHGHSIMTIIEKGKNRDSYLKKKLNTETLENQIEMFLTIIEGMRFYLDCLDSSPRFNGKEPYKNEYLSDSFLTNTEFFEKIKAKKS